MDVSEIRQALADVISNATGLRAYQWIPETINPPCCVVEWPDSIDFAQAMGKGLTKYELPIRVLTAAASDRAGQKELEKYAACEGAFSIRDAIWANNTLNGTCSQAFLSGIDGFGSRQVGTTNYIEFTAHITIVG